ncbi:hypothetical protein O9X81_05180 [Agrobacterium salinitolerans]|uniref:hypothetical protein n=1 Tax=Agrobacterium salinitolerans TaxID=1183413 RepID=UPI0022B826A0|nr:hypothetical protein [Agrobacterium salinitolerans]MCZ7855999.1 hypothetical protein [Agrobacterium salinitolerans]
MATKEEARRELARRELERRRSQAAQPSAPPQSKAFTSSILPFSKDEQGNVSFDSNAGILGSIKRAVMLPGEVMAGETPVFGPDGRVSQEVIGRSLEAASLMSPSAPGLRSGSGLVPGEASQMRRSTPPVPSADDLYGAADDAYNAMRNSGVAYSGDAVRDFATGLKSGLDTEGFIAKVTPKTQSILDDLANPPEGAIADIQGLQAARKAFGRISQNFNEPEEQAAAVRAIRGLDDFIGTDNPAAVVAGTASDAANALKTANANFAAAKRSDLLTGVERAADLRAAAANSGANTGNAIRQRIASALLKPKDIAGYSPEEVAALEKIVTGTPAQNATRYVGNLLGGGGGMGQMLTTAAGAGAGGIAGGGLGAAAGAALPIAVGSTSKSISNMLTRRALGAADEMVRARSPLYQTMKDSAPLEVVRQARAEQLIRALLMGGNARAANGGGGGY